MNFRITPADEAQDIRTQWVLNINAIRTEVIRHINEIGQLQSCIVFGFQ